MAFQKIFAGWYRNRVVWVAAILLATATGAVTLTGGADRNAAPADLVGQLETRMRVLLEQADPQQHNHAGHTVELAAATQQQTVICGVRIYGYEPADVTALAEVRTVYGFHLCGVAEPQRPWDVAVKLAGPLILDMSTEPPGIEVVEATADVMFVDRLRQMFPDKYAELAIAEALTDSEAADLRRRYDAAAGI
ncbi:MULTISPECIES: hypothetical protein [unclassified Solwaraspora]|uniref:hypothetical protein n=1 Tax=unclassified Solwaraspora TaxID=2627926 RepID=UPI00259BB811|nr:hypothetical protein [Solwaraspora sp. WMMA2056]WJK39740.1 hypothetical protein O7608_25320 [Solwaraspora sp. WMMA2056]